MSVTLEAMLPRLLKNRLIAGKVIHNSDHPHRCDNSAVSLGEFLSFMCGENQDKIW